MAATAVVVIDMLNPYEHRDAEVLARHVGAIVAPLSALIEKAHASTDVELIYVNDQYGDFSATREDLVERALAGRHADLVQPVRPPASCAFLPKVRHSAFYSTTLEYLLRLRGVTTVVLTGQVTEQCILYSALDAYVRHYDLRIPRDAVAAIHPDLGDAALRMMELNMRAEVCESTACLDQ